MRVKRPLLLSLAACSTIVAALLGTSIESSEQDSAYHAKNEDPGDGNSQAIGSGTTDASRSADSRIAATSKERFAAFHNVNVSWRRPEMPDGVNPPYGPKYEALESKAVGGDAEAAFALYQILDMCANAFDSESGKNAAIDMIRETHRIRYPGWDKPLRLRSPEKLEVIIGRIESSFENCYPITAEQKAEKLRWLERAADGGPVVAIAMYANAAADPEKSLNAARTAWNRGAAQALSIIQHRYEAAYRNGADPRGHIKAFASLYAFTYLLSESRSSMSDRRLQETIRTLEAAKTSLHDYEIREAIGIAVDVIESNSQCCVLF